jgi:hypothetical protein
LTIVHAINLKRLSDDDTLVLTERDTLESWALWWFCKKHFNLLTPTLILYRFIRPLLNSKFHVINEYKNRHGLRCGSHFMGTTVFMIEVPSTLSLQSFVPIFFPPSRVPL